MIEPAPAAAAPPPSVGQRLAAFRERHALLEHVLFFVGGFIFDALMVNRIDDAPVLIQQGVYLAVVGLLLAGLNAWDHCGVEPPRALRWLWRWSQPLLHFMLGTLLNAYVLFYFKSASGLSAFLFLGVICALLAVNELPAMRRLGPVVLYGLYSFCLTSYFAYLYPVLLGRLRPWMFFLAVATSLVPLGLLARAHHRSSGDTGGILRQALAPALGVQVLLLLLFVLHQVPPVPISLLHIGIYHGVERDADGRFRLLQRPVPWWRFWAPDEEDFRAQPGDRIYCFVRLFAPRDFHDEVRARWARRDPDHGWQRSDAVPMQVVGGRREGFGGYSYKQNWRPGEWRVTVETVDGREIGRRLFTVSEEPLEEERTLVETSR